MFSWRFVKYSTHSEQRSESSLLRSTSTRVSSTCRAVPIVEQQRSHFVIVLSLLPRFRFRFRFRFPLLPFRRGQFKAPSAFSCSFSVQRCAGGLPPVLLSKAH